MSNKARLVACLGAALVPWLLAMQVPTEAADETLCSQANPTPPPCIPSTIIPLPDGQTLRHYDSSFVDPTIHTYVLAALGTVAAGTGPSSNPRIIVVDTTTNQVVNEYNAKPTFAGLCPPNTSGFVGPSGVILIEGRKGNQGQDNQ